MCVYQLPNSKNWASMLIIFSFTWYKYNHILIAWVAEDVINLLCAKLFSDMKTYIAFSIIINLYQVIHQNITANYGTFHIYNNVIMLIMIVFKIIVIIMLKILIMIKPKILIVIIIYTVIMSKILRVIMPKNIITDCDLIWMVEYAFSVDIYHWFQLSALNGLFISKRLTQSNI